MQFPTLRSISSVDSVDFTETKTALHGFVHVLLMAVEFGLIFFLIAALRLATLDSTPESPTLGVLLGFVPAVALGVGLPVLVQYWTYFNELNELVLFRVAGLLVTLGTYTLLFFYHPAASLIFAVVYLGGRIAIISSIFGLSRIRASLA